MANFRKSRLRSQPLVIIACSAVVFAGSAQADSSTAASQFENCHKRAVAFSGYQGKVPDRYLPGGALKGAAKGSGAARLAAFLTGKSKKERKRAARRGAIFGGLFGIFKRSEAKKDQDRKAKLYRLELDACMRAKR